MMGEIGKSDAISNMSSIDTDAERLMDRLRGFDRVVIAFSGGVDSSVVAAAATRSSLNRAIAVTADSPSVPRWQIDLAKKIANEIGIEHQIVETDEGADSEYRRNDSRRCFYCKETLYRMLTRIASLHAGATIVSGTNADDLGDHRPGIEAGRTANVKTPLADLGLGKSQVRRLARWFGLSNHELPASPCLASRIAYGVEVTPERLMRVEKAEAWLQDRGFIDRRVRLHAGELARIEVPQNQLTRLLQLDASGELSNHLRKLGFNFVTVDLQGFQSGSMNRVIVPMASARLLSGSPGELR